MAVFSKNDTLESKIKQVLIEWGIELVEDMRKEIHKALSKSPDGKHTNNGSTSELEGSVKYEIKRVSGGLQFQLLMNDYWEAVDKGRGKTKKTGSGAVRESVGADWQASKGISPRQIIYDMTVAYNKKKGIKTKVEKLPFKEAADELAYLLSAKIHNQGIEGRPFYDKVINQKRIDRLQEMLEPVIIDDISLAFSNDFK